MAAPVVIDTHTHVCSPDLDRYVRRPRSGVHLTWFDDHPLDAPGLLVEMDRAGVHGAVLVQPTLYGFDNSYVADARALAPTRFVNAAIVDMAAADRVAQLTYWVRERGLLGLRLFDIPPASAPWLGDPALADVLGRVRHLGVRLSVCVLADGLPQVARLAASAPDLPIALDHCGFADLSDGPPFAGAAPLVALASHPNVRLKVTGTLLASAGGDPRDVVEHLAGVFGAERLMWGSDFPQHHDRPYPAQVDLARHACSRLTAAEQDRFLGGTALELWPELVPGPAP